MKIKHFFFFWGGGGGGGSSWVGQGGCELRSEAFVKIQSGGGGRVWGGGRVGGGGGQGGCEWRSVAF